MSNNNEFLIASFYKSGISKINNELVVLTSLPNEEVATVFGIHTTNQIINDVETQILLVNRANRQTENKFRKELGLSTTNGKTFRRE